MKSIPSYLLLLLLLVSCSERKKEGDAGSRFYAGAAQSVITPPEGTYLIEPVANKATGIHDDLYVRAVALGDGENVFVIAGFDLVGFDKTLVNSIRQAVYDSAGINAGQLMLNCSHTHNSPITVGGFYSLPADPADRKSARDKQWEKRMVAISAGTVKRATGNMKEVSVSQGKAPVEIGYNRRLNDYVQASMIANPNGPSLKGTDVLVIRDNESELAVLFSYAAHPVSVHITSTEFTADYPGYASRRIRSEYPGSIPVFLQGCGGNVNSAGLQGGFEAAALDGNKLGEAVLLGIEHSEAMDPSPIYYGQRDFYLPLMDFDEETAGSIVKRIGESLKTIEENPDLNPNWYTDNMIHWARRLKQIAENRDSMPGLPFHAQAVALGKSLAIVAYPDEVFVDYALYIREHSPFEQTIVLGYTNGCASYIPSAEAFFLGGYEPYWAQVITGQPFLTPGCDRIIKTETMTLLNELRKKYPE